MSELDSFQSDAVLDFDRLATPIAGENPAGVDIREAIGGADYWAIRNPRNESSDIEKRVFVEPDNDSYSLARCRWDEVVQLAQDALAEKSKDYDIAAWLCEGLIRKAGFAGLRDGLRLARELAINFWEHLYPLPDGDDFSPRVRMFSNLFHSDVFSFAIKSIAVTEGENYTLLDYEMARQLRDVTEPEERKASLGGRRDVTLGRFEDQLRNSSVEFCRRLAADIEACRSEVQQLSALWQERCGKDDVGQDVAPSTRKIEEILASCLGMIHSIIPDRLVVESSDAGGSPSGELLAVRASPDIAADAANGVRGLTRDVALEMLGKIADFFDRSEPHSPVSHHIRQAVRWGRMSLPQLLSELIPDETARQDVFTRVGIEQPKENGNEESAGY